MLEEIQVGDKVKIIDFTGKDEEFIKEFTNGVFAVTNVFKGHLACEGYELYRWRFKYIRRGYNEITC